MRVDCEECKRLWAMYAEVIKEHIRAVNSYQISVLAHDDAAGAESKQKLDAVDERRAGIRESIRFHEETAHPEEPVNG